MIEKWRWIWKYQCWDQQELTRFKLLWQSPFSNSVSFEFLDIPFLGWYCFGKFDGDQLTVGCQIVLENGVMRHVGNENRQEEKLKRIIDSQIVALV